MISISWGYSSVVEHLTADQEVPGSNPGAPCWVAKFGNINFKTSLLLFIFCQTDLSNFFSVDEDKIFRKSGHQFFHLWIWWILEKPKSWLRSEAVVVWCCQNEVCKFLENAKSWLQIKADKEIYRFKSSCPLWTWNIWNIQSEAVDVVKMKYVISLLLFWVHEV